MKNTLITLILLVAVFAGGYLLGQNNNEVSQTTTRIDTVFYERPQAAPSTLSLARVSVPMLLFAPSDTITQTVVISAGKDSVQLQVAIERREYKDSTYRAVVSGPTIGGYRPSLDFIETYNVTHTQSVVRRSRFALTLGAGAAYTPQGIQPTIGVQFGVVLWRL